MQELERAANLGLAGAMISINPILPYTHAAYETFWAAAQDLDMPLSLHTGTMRWRPGLDTGGVVLQNPFDFPNREYFPRQCINGMIFTGVFERYPRLKVGVIEFEVSWAPYFLRSMDNFYKERAVGVQGIRFKEDMLPSDFFRRNVFIGFQEDDLGLRDRHIIGVDNLLWGSDYPHAESTFPRSREILEQIFQGMPEEDKAKIAGENTARLYGFPRIIQHCTNMGPSVNFKARLGPRRGQRCFVFHGTDRQTSGRSRDRRRHRRLRDSIQPRQARGVGRSGGEG